MPRSANSPKPMPASLPHDSAALLRDIGQRHFAPLMQRPGSGARCGGRASCASRDWFANWETDRRLNVAARDHRAIRQPDHCARVDRQFMLSARADRIERRTDRTFALLDYKTGTPPSAKQVRIGLSPQLTLEAAILRAGGFRRYPRRFVRERTGLRQAQRQQSAGQRVRARVEARPQRAGAVARRRRERGAREARRLIRQFEDEATPYTSLDLAMWSNRYGSYDDLARIKEWSRRRWRSRAMSARAAFRRTPSREQVAGLRPRRLGVRLRQCRRRQDPCAGAAGDPAAARPACRPGKHPLHHLHQGRRRQHGAAGVFERSAIGSTLDDDALDAAIRSDRHRQARRETAHAAPATCSPARWKRRAG